LAQACFCSSNPVSVQTVSSPSSQLVITPNPASSQTTLQISLEQSLDVTVEIFDVMGRAVQTIFSGILQGKPFAPGEYEIIPFGKLCGENENPKFFLQQKLIVAEQ
jgi:hypothetical protein